MKNGLCVLFIRCSLPVFSQKNKVGLSFSTDAAFRIYRSEITEAWGNNQQPKLGYSLTAHYERELTNNWSLITGLFFTNKGYQSEKNDLRFSDQIQPRQGFVAPTQEPTSYTSYRYRYSFYQMGVPVGVNYYVRLKKVNFIFGGGLAANYLLNVRYTSIFYKIDGSKPKVSHTNDDMEYYNRLTFSAFTQVGIEINLPRNLKFRIAPNVSYSLTNIMDKKVAYKIYPYSIGIGYGVFWGF